MLLLKRKNTKMIGHEVIEHEVIEHEVIEHEVSTENEGGAE
jgi:hypothetical protein